MRTSLTRFGLAVCAGLAVISASSAADRSTAPSSSPPSSTIDAAWQTEVTRALDRLEYAVTWQPQAGSANGPASWQAPNRAHGFRSDFSAQGVRLEPREGSSAAWSWSLTAATVGRCNNRSATGPAEIHVDGQRVQLQRALATEWYDNSTRGLEQGFNITARPRDCSDTQRSPLVIEWTLGGSLVPTLSDDKLAIDFSDGSGQRVLRYAALEVIDSSGQSLPAHLELFSDESARGIRIVIDDAKAAYPIVVDPLITSAAWTGQSDQILSRFGVSVSAAGDVNGDGFDDVIVGAERFDAGQTDEGRVFVYYGSASGLPAAASWTAEANQAVALFGSAVSSAGDVNGDGYSDIVIGARQYDVTLPDEGAAFVYFGSATGLNNGSRPSGTPANADWTKAGGQSGARFGAAVANAADVNGDGKTDVLIGAPQFDDGEADEGAAYLFAGSATGLAATPLWSAQSNQDTAEFGSSVATAGDVNADGYLDVVVGAHNYTSGQAAEGAAFVYYGASAGPATSPSWIAYGDQPVAGFGSSVAAAGDVNGDGFADLMVGARLYDDGSTDEGALFVFHGSATGFDSNGSRATGFPSNADWRAESDMASAEFGAAVAPAGDVNGDGYGDVIAGSPNYSAGESSEGGAFVYFGSALGLNRNGSRTQGSPANADWKVESNQASAEFGTSVGAAGDINGDSFVDLIVGAPRYDDPETDEGRALVYLGGASGPATTPAWTVTGDYGSMQLGYSIASAGDVNGDGYDDVIAGAPYYNGYYYQGGRALEV